VYETGVERERERERNKLVCVVVLEKALIYNSSRKKREKYIWLELFQLVAASFVVSSLFKINM